MKQGLVYYGQVPAGVIHEDESGFVFRYNQEYLDSAEAKPISLTLPLRREAYESQTMFPFFDGLIPEGWLLDIATDSWKINPRDRMELLLTCCRDCIGAVSVERISEEEL